MAHHTISTSAQPLRGIDYHNLMSRRIRSILLICSSYDAYTLEEDGRLEVQINREYMEHKSIQFSTKRYLPKLTLHPNCSPQLFSRHNLEFPTLRSLSNWIVAIGLQTQKRLFAPR
jgi:hypothetical protein